MPKKINLWLWDMLLQGREFRNKTNENWQKIMDWSGELTDGLAKLEKAIADTEANCKTYTNQEIKKEANTREAVDRSTNARIDNLIAGQDQPSENIDARVDAHGKSYPVLKQRLDAEQLAAESKSTIRFNLDTILAQDLQDIGLFHDKTLSDVQSAILMNVSSTDEQADIKLQNVSETGYTSELDGLIFAKLGPGERFQYSLIGEVAV
ncbi:alpha-amylase [Listeria ilorinensis]|uniref:alpha-amylase n=1 Tax=Listeria ilorinensis TaxID=2867439 RepID=UPI001EF5DA36|nr:alpha-amylase [Listeria ilorinensis]